MPPHVPQPPPAVEFRPGLPKHDDHPLARARTCPRAGERTSMNGPGLDPVLR
jgi:hypothetical protein